MEGLFGQMVRLGVETALRRFIDDVEGAPAAWRRRRDLRRPRPRRVPRRPIAGACWPPTASAHDWPGGGSSRPASPGGLAPEDLFAIGEPIFDYIDELSAGVRRGLRARAARRGRRAPAAARAARRRCWRRAAGRGRGPRAAAGWTPAGGCRRRSGARSAAPAAARRARRRTCPTSPIGSRALGHGVVAAARDGVAVAIVGDPGAPGRRRQLGRRRGRPPRRARPAVALARAAHSLRRALATLRLTDAPGLSDADEHLGALMLGADLALAAELAGHQLAPLDRLAPGAAARLAGTLRAWLDRPGQVQAVAQALGVHPQTVRYRVRQLRELFGDRLEDPDARFELSLALRARELAGQAAPDAPPRHRGGRDARAGCGPRRTARRARRRRPHPRRPRHHRLRPPSGTPCWSEPAAVINCAAWTDVDGAESAEDDAAAVNGLAAGSLANAASEAGALTWCTSRPTTSSPATGREPYVESDPVDPKTAYGRTKLHGEAAVREAAPRHAIVRTAWVFGPGGKNFVDTMRRLAASTTS